MEQPKSNAPQSAPQSASKLAPTPPFDRALVRARRGRAGKALAGGKLEAFLYERIAQDLTERLFDVNRKFETALIFGSAELAGRITALAGDKIGYAVIADHTNFAHGVQIIASEEALPFAPARFDLVISALSLQSVNAVQAAMGGFQTLLKPDGLFVGAVLGGNTLSELRRALYSAEEAVYGRISPRVSPMIDVQQAAQLLQAAGFSMPVTDRDYVQVNYKKLGSLFSDLRAMGENNALSQRAKTPVSKRFFTALKAAYLAHCEDKEGRYRAGFDLIYMTGWAPHPAQPKPLKPGSAKTRLSDALGVKEGKL